MRKIAKTSKLLTLILTLGLAAFGAAGRGEAAERPGGQLIGPWLGMRQDVIDARPQRPLPQLAGPDGTDAQLVGAGIGGGAGGVLAGGAAGLAVGLSLANGCQGEDCGLVGLATTIIGAGVGGSLGIPLGVHLANGRQGSYALEAAASVAIATAGVLAIAESDNRTAQDAVMIAVPVTQLVSSILIERHTARSRHAHEQGS
jgi:hypothetical protein